MNLERGQMIRRSRNERFLGRRMMWSTVVIVGVAMASGAPLDAGKSTLVAQFSQLNVPVDAPFTKFGGAISYDAAAPGRSTAHIEVDMRSLDVGDEDYNAEVRKKEWFDSAHFPKASLDATGFRPLGGNKFEAAGKLNLKGRVQDLQIPVALKTEGGSLVFEGAVPISRSYFGIGDPQWKDTVADQVQVKFHFVVPNNH